jgi:class 3 adenylate cyclase
VTVLITDIVDSTRLVAEIGDRQWRVLLDRHDDAVRSQVRRYGGREIGNRGDGFLATFDTPARAVRCAAAIAAAIAALGLSVRCGVHIGEIHQKRKEISGIAVHIAARIAAIARGSLRLENRARSGHRIRARLRRPRPAPAARLVGGNPPLYDACIVLMPPDAWS